jgi:hypothetical protein
LTGCAPPSSSQRAGDSCVLSLPCRFRFPAPPPLSLAEARLHRAGHRRRWTPSTSGSSRSVVPRALGAGATRCRQVAAGIQQANVVVTRVRAEMRIAHAAISPCPSSGVCRGPLSVKGWTGFHRPAGGDRGGLC